MHSRGGDSFISCIWPKSGSVIVGKKCSMISIGCLNRMLAKALRGPTTTSKFSGPVSRDCHFDASFLRKCDANYVPLTPLSLFSKATTLYPDRPAYVFMDETKTWKEVSERCKKYASALVTLGVQRNEVVSVLASNTPLAFESHFGVLGARAVLHTINTRLDARQISFQLHHAGAKVVLADPEFAHLLADALKLLPANASHPKIVLSGASESHGTSSTNYEDFLNLGTSGFELLMPLDEWDACCVNYTSGTTGDPKGVVYHHRGAYLTASANAFESGLRMLGSFLWVVPMFHCNGWCYPWTLAGTASTSYLLNHVRPGTLFSLVDKHKIELVCGAPITMNTMLNYRGPERVRFKHNVRMWVGGSPPPATVMQQVYDELNIEVKTIYGLTETFGVATSFKPTAPYNQEGSSKADNVIVQSANIGTHSVTVRDPDTMQEVPADSLTVGEVMFRSNSVMKGYLKNESATLSTFEGGWFRTGDLAVNHGNGRFEIKDRSKDIIISGGENISSVEVENIMLTHGAIEEVAVVGMPSEKWGEVPCAFITIKPHTTVVPTEAELLEWVRNEMAHFQTPKKIVVLHELPKTSTGKTQKNILRNQAKSL